MNTDLFISNELAALVTPLLSLASTGFVHGQWKRKVLLLGQLAAVFFAIAAFLLAIIQSLMEPIVLGPGWFSMRFDLATSGLIAAITFIAAVVTAFSERYLGGEKTREKFLCGLSFLSSCSALLVSSDNLLVAFAFWNMLSCGLWWTMHLQEDGRSSSSVVLAHHLLSDLAIGAALLLVYSSTGTLSFSELPRVLPLLNGPFNLFGVASPLTPGTLASLLLVLSFSVKSALFPFHRWLIATLDAPTPLSGLLHAGVVNVSAIMAWRTMPLLQENPTVLVGWGLLSAVSAVVGTLSMSAQPDVKRKLVYSTVGQMGFMSLQCASGAIGAALFHLIAHGMFKCHMFLQSGSAVAEGLNKRKFGYVNTQSASEGKALFFVGATGLGCCVAIHFLCVNSGWTALSAIITAAALLSAVPAISRIDLKSLCFFWSTILAIVLVSAFASSKFESLFHASTSTSALLPLCISAFAIIAIFLRLARSNHFAKSLYVHSLNGFYAEEVALSAAKPLQAGKNSL